MVNYFLRVLSETHGCHHQEDTRLKLQFVANTDHSIHAGLVVVEAMARRFDLWRKLGKLACLDLRKDKKRGFGPEVIVGQLIYALCSGGGCLSDSEALNDDPLARELFGVGKFADQSQVGEWLREQSGESVAALRQLLHQFVAWVWQQAEPRRQPQGCERSTPAHARTQLFPLEGKGSALLRRQQEQPGRLPEGHRRRGWHYTVSYNKWTGPLERTAQELPALSWKENGNAHHAFLRHQPEGRTGAQLFAVSRRRDGLFDHYGFIACYDGQTDAARVGERHHLKGDKEQLFREVLNGLDPHRSPRSALIANPIYYLIAALAYDLMVPSSC